MKREITDFSAEELKNELKRREAATPVATPKNEVDWNTVYDYAIEGISQLAKDGYQPKDFEHYLYEAVINAVYGNGVWPIINSLAKY